ncbi:MAG: hypothetical protein AB2776_18825 [Candidatus Thiodiazotropha endolucinida]
MDMKKIISALPFLLTALNCDAGTALCEIKVLDIQTGAKQTIEQEFELSGEPQQKHFYIPGSGYRYTLVFFSLDTGTALWTGDYVFENEWQRLRFGNDTMTIVEVSV